MSGRLQVGRLWVGIVAQYACHLQTTEYCMQNTVDSTIKGSMSLGQLIARLPVRSGLSKQDTGGLVVRWVTTSESPLLYIFIFFFAGMFEWTFWRLDVF
jgi:hypothetical protein